MSGYTFADWLRSEMEDRNIGTKELQAAAEVNRSTATRWLVGKYTPGMDTLSKIVKAWEIEEESADIAVGLLAEHGQPCARWALRSDVAGSFAALVNE